jgi:succinoglycan biosynthesis protein ExoA
MQTESVVVSVLVPVYNEELHLRDAAAAMLAQELDGTAEFLFIDGGSQDSSPAILRELAASDPRVRVLDNPARRTPHALNLGLRAARGEFIARMDAHAIYPPRYLASGVARLRLGDVAWVSGPQLAVGRSPGSRRIARALTTSLGRGEASFRQMLQGESDVDTGFTGVWRRDTLVSQRGWDEEWVNDQDVELAARIRKLGGRIVCIPEMAADYVPRETLRTLARQYLTYGTYRVKTAQRHPESLRRSQLLPPALVLTATAAAVGPFARLRGAARLGMSGYALTLGVSSMRAAREGDAREASTLPAVWATMHLSYGVGFLRGCLRYGPPIESIARLIGRRAQSRRATR